MLGGWERFSDEQRRTFLAAIEEDVDRVGRLLEDLLAVSRIDARRAASRREAVDVVQLCTRVVEKSSGNIFSIVSRFSSM